MKISPGSNQYFNSPEKSPQKLKKLFTSIRGHSLALQTAPQVFSPDDIDKGTRPYGDEV